MRDEAGYSGGLRGLHACDGRSEMETWAVEHDAEDLFLWSLEGSELMSALTGNSMRAPPSTRNFQRFKLSFFYLM